METNCNSTPNECRDSCVSADGLGTVWPSIAARRKKKLEERAALPTVCTFCGCATLVEDWKGSGAINMHCFACKQLHPAELPALTTADVRALLRRYGYRLQLKTSSLGTCANVVHVDSGSVLGNVESFENLERWTAFQQITGPNKVRIELWAKTEGVFGVKTWFSPIPTI